MQVPILAVTGGRDVEPTSAELAALFAACYRRRVRVLRVGDCPTGVDACVAAAVRALRPGLDPGQRSWTLEVWTADWSRLGRRAGPERNQAMLRGDSSGTGGVIAVGGIVSAGAAGVLVAWPGGKGTASACQAARDEGIRVVGISEIVA